MTIFRIRMIIAATAFVLPTMGLIQNVEAG